MYLVRSGTVHASQADTEDAGRDAFQNRFEQLLLDWLPFVIVFCTVVPWNQSGFELIKVKKSNQRVSCRKRTWQKSP